MDEQDDAETAEEDVLRGIAVEEIEPDSDSIPTWAGDGGVEVSAGSLARYKVVPAGEPQEEGTKYSVVDLDSGTTSYAGRVQKYGSRMGISRASTLLMYDRFEAEDQIGLWAHFMWPSVVAESNGRYISINAWDRAHFTWGFYQLAAHTPRDNLVLLMRELVTLPSAKRFFPDLMLSDGKLARRTGEGPVSLEEEQEVAVGNRTEMQLVDFMAYLNPSSFRVDEGEVLTAAKFAAWAMEDKAMRDATVEVSIAIMKRKIKARAGTFELVGRRPELAIWISDMFHHGRGSTSQARAALALPDFEQQLEALSRIDTTGRHSMRLGSVKGSVRKLLDEDRFKDVRFGEGPLSLEAQDA